MGYEAVPRCRKLSGSAMTAIQGHLDGQPSCRTSPRGTSLGSGGCYCGALVDLERVSSLGR